MRIAVVQHGDYAEARAFMDAGRAEFYSGQRYTIGSLDDFFGDVPHLILGLDGRSPRTLRGRGDYRCVAPRLPRGVPGRVRSYLAARTVLRELHAFRPTHLLLRSSNDVSLCVLRWAVGRRLPTAVVTAMQFKPASATDRAFCSLANAANVAFLGNHNRAATDSAVETGLDPGKAIAWDWPPLVSPDDYPAKRGIGRGRPLLQFVGAVSESKGATDLVLACETLRDAGRDLSLRIYGDGPARAAILAGRGTAEGWIECPGRVGHDVAVAAIREADLVVVPSRRSFPEGLPLVISEGLAVRTPLVASDHPSFTQYFRDGGGLRFFREGDPHDLAAVLGRLLDDPDDYRALSEGSADAWRSFQIETRFHHLLERLAREWGMASARAPLTDSARVELPR